jgi:hypothetical protein
MPSAEEAAKALWLARADASSPDISRKSSSSKQLEPDVNPFLEQSGGRSSGGRNDGAEGGSFAEYMASRGDVTDNAGNRAVVETVDRIEIEKSHKADQEAEARFELEAKHMAVKGSVEQADFESKPKAEQETRAREEQEAQHKAEQDAKLDMKLNAGEAKHVAELAVQQAEQNADALADKSAEQEARSGVALEEGANDTKLQRKDAWFS